MLSTVRINTEGPSFPAKTPGRDLKGRLENASAIGSTVHRGKGKNLVYPKTPLPLNSARAYVPYSWYYAN